MDEDIVSNENIFDISIKAFELYVNQNNLGEYSKVELNNTLRIRYIITLSILKQKIV